MADDHAHEKALATPIPRTPSPTATTTQAIPDTSTSLPPPHAPFASVGRSGSPGSFAYSQGTSANMSVGGNSDAALNEKPGESAETSRNASPESGEEAGSSRKRWVIPLVALAALAVLVVVIVVPVYFKVVKPRQNGENLSASTSGSGSSSGSNGGSSGSPTGAITGGDGSEIVAADGSKFTYRNSFGGFWVQDPNDPYGYNAQPNSWTPPLNQTWKWGTDKVYGVNLGGWFVLEPFISPALFQKYPSAKDEWTLSTAMAADTASGGLQQLETHYDTFITEQDFAAIAGAGLNWVRIPLPYWAIEMWDGEPFLAKTSWKYFLRALEWARKYGLRVNLDLHTIPGSQNGYNHSGRGGQVNFMNGPMGIANAQRALEYIRILTEFISQPEYNNLVPMFGIVNEALVATIGKDAITTFYFEAHQMMRSITGTGEGHGPFISIHDGFQGLDTWANFLPGSDRIALDSHPYFSFSGDPATDPIGVDGQGDGWPEKACNRFVGVPNAKKDFGVVVAGEFSNGYNDCGLFLRGVGNPTTYGGDCSFWEDAKQWNDTTKSGIKQFALASMDSLGDYFFWTWKIGNSTSGVVESPLWSYSHGLDMGFMPTDPRQADGTCQKLGVSVDSAKSFSAFQPWQTGGSGAGTISSSASAAFGTWPPTSINGADGGALATYTSTGSVVTLPVPTFTSLGNAGASKTGSVDGWFNDGDKGGGPTPVSGCTYPDAWTAASAGGSFQCAGAAPARRTAAPEPRVRFRR